MDLQEPTRKKLKELSDEERKLRERIKEIQTEKKAVFRMLNELGKGQKKRRRRPISTHTEPPSKAPSPNQK